MSSPGNPTVHIERVFMAYYMDMLTPPTIAEVTGRLRRIAADVVVLDALGDELGLRNAKAFAQATLMDLGAISVVTHSALRRKARTIRRWSHLASSPHLIKPMLDAAMLADGRRLYVTSARRSAPASTAVPEAWRASPTGTGRS